MPGPGFTAGIYGTQLAARFGGVRRLLAVTAAASAAGFLILGGMINTSRQIGAAIGAALLPAVAEGIGHGAGAAGVTGDRAAMLTGAVASALAMLVAWRASRAGDPAAERG